MRGFNGSVQLLELIAVVLALHIAFQRSKRVLDARESLVDQPDSITVGGSGLRDGGEEPLVPVLGLGCEIRHNAS